MSEHSITKAELIEAMKAGEVLRYGKWGPYMYSKGRERHPLRSTVHRLIAQGVLIESDDANEVQRRCGLATYRIKGGQ